MSKQNKVALSSFMKKQISEKSSKKTVASKVHDNNPAAAKEKDAANGENQEQKNQEELTEEEEAEALEEAKKASKSKAAQFDQTDMIKKLIVENIIKYVVIICVLIIASIGVIKFGSAFLAFLNGLLYSVIMSAFGK